MPHGTRVPVRARQLCAVIGYESPAHGVGRGMTLHVACGVVPDCSLRYAGKVEVPIGSARYGRELTKALRSLRSAVHPPGVQSPLPASIHRVLPVVLVEVSHGGWTPAGMMRQAVLVAFLEGAPAANREDEKALTEWL